MKLRCAKPDDLGKITAFYRAVIDNTPKMERYARWVWGLHPTEPMIENYIGQNAMYLLEENGNILGAMAVTLSQGEDYHSINWSVDAMDDEVAVVHILCVNPDFQRRGLGKKMVEESILLAKKEGKKAVRLDALESNAPAHRMYKALGFEQRDRQHLYADNIGWTDFLFFECEV